MKSGTTFPGTLSFVGSREGHALEGVTLIFNPTGALLDAPSDWMARFPLCQLEELYD